MSTQLQGKTEGVTGRLPANKFKNDTIQLKGKKLNEIEWNQKKNDIANIDDKTNTTNNELITHIEIPTGSVENFKLKNIYDLAGNMWEWTTEVGNHQSIYESGDPPAVFRGGAASHDGEYFSICFRSADRGAESGLSILMGFRVVLYIK